MEDESVVKYIVKKKSEENKSYDETHQKKAGVVASIKEKAESIGHSLKHVATTKETSKLMQDIRDAKGKPKVKGRE